MEKKREMNCNPSILLPVCVSVRLLVITSTCALIYLTVCNIPLPPVCIAAPVGDSLSLSCGSGVIPATLSLLRLRSRLGDRLLCVSVSY